MNQEILQYMLPVWNEVLQNQYLQFSASTISYMLDIYKSIERAYVSYASYAPYASYSPYTSYSPHTQKKNISYTHTVFNPHKNNLFSLSLYNSTYLPEKIRQTIPTFIRHTYSFQLKLEHATVTIYIYTHKELQHNKIEDMKKYIYILLHVLYSQQTKACAKTLTIHLVLTKHKKYLPEQDGNVLNENHVNSAITTGCVPDGTVLIYREEEWTKTLAHELFHILGLDFSNYFTEAHTSRLKRLFHIQSTYNAFETYSESMALILHTCMISYTLVEKYKALSREKQEKEQLYIYYNEILLTYELFFSTLQSVKIFTHMKITKEDIKASTYDIVKKEQMKERYKENTNVFHYYILKTELLHNINEYISWIRKYNTTLFQFDNTHTTINIYIDLLHDFFHKEDSTTQQKMVEHSKRFIRNITDDSSRENKHKEALQVMRTMRMSINQMEFIKEYNKIDI